MCMSSCSSVTMTIVGDRTSHTMRQKSTTVRSKGPGICGDKEDEEEEKEEDALRRKEKEHVNIIIRSRTLSSYKCVCLGVTLIRDKLYSIK